MSRHLRSAFTLIELLVVIAIIGTLIALLMPAVQQVREAAAKTTCSNNLHQLIIGYHNYEGNYKHFPPSAINDPTKTVGWGVFILPFIEQSALYDKYNFSAPFFYTNAAFGIDNQSVSNTHIALFQCPATFDRQDPYSYTFNFPPFPPISWQASPSDYCPVRGVADSLNTYLGLGLGSDQLKGFLQPDATSRFSSVQDGASNTILLAEIAGKNQLWQAGKLNGNLTGFYGGQGGWADATSGNTALYGSSSDGIVTPGSCGINCSNDFGFYSFHRAGINAGFGDGSVRYLNTGLDIRILSALVTRAGNEPNTVDQ